MVRVFVGVLKDSEDGCSTLLFGLPIYGNMHHYQQSLFNLIFSNEWPMCQQLCLGQW